MSHLVEKFNLILIVITSVIQQTFRTSVQNTFEAVITVKCKCLLPQNTTFLYFLHSNLLVLRLFCSPSCRHHPSQVPHKVFGMRPLDYLVSLTIL